MTSDFQYFGGHRGVVHLNAQQQQATVPCLAPLLHPHHGNCNHICMSILCQDHDGVENVGSITQSIHNMNGAVSNPRSQFGSMINFDSHYCVIHVGTNGLCCKSDAEQKFLFAIYYATSEIQ